MSEPKYPVERADLTRHPWRALAIVAKVIESGDQKYQAGDWIMAPERIDGRRDLNSALRHIGEYIEGKNVDEDSGESPLAHAAARLLFLLEREARGIKGGGWRIGSHERNTDENKPMLEQAEGQRRVFPAGIDAAAGMTNAEISDAIVETSARMKSAYTGGAVWSASLRHLERLQEIRERRAGLVSLPE